MISVLGREWKTKFANLLRSAQSELLIASPYVTHEGVEFVLGNLSLTARDEGHSASTSPAPD